MDGANEQLLTKYQKLASEYSKIRAQANVLKKAVIDEQTRNVHLQEQLKEKEVERRRSVQELDSLSFRNQQLTKRVTVLQKELDEIQNQGKKSTSKPSEKQSAGFPVALPNILNEEFQKKIVENANLMSEISCKDIEIITLNETIYQLEFQLDRYEKNRTDTKSNYEVDPKNVERKHSNPGGISNKKHKSRWIPSIEKQEESAPHHGVAEDFPDRNFEDSADDSDAKNLNSGCSVYPSSVESKARVLDPVSISSHCNSNPNTTEKPPTFEETSNEMEIRKLLELEKELYWWKAEYNVLKIKFDELQINEYLQMDRVGKTRIQSAEATNMLGRLIAPFEITEEIETREAKIKEYFMQRINQLISDKHYYRTKNLAITADTEVIEMHLEVSESRRKMCEETLGELRANLASLQEDQEVQEGNYKAQLNTISEHLANMNDKLVQQTEEIQQLKFRLRNQNAKKEKQ